ncbi:glycosyltransferase family 8 protein [Thermothielavioides terrestris NRRL 8126]|uniref:Glycosyltransferase family 8 protein n=1 Tax=Thermothielavioides terrestris (strain ATCC 38088 / NRRL 8126) TaxID=578455 RepID=G2QVZ8_THETT|nr:glycosyltransferase family 8 protein [Thermothielavioides terrestris NRRL 8126]AEO64730.1 glycosyltransferase family 8 protein [Thermothielavioides terrestris NRRL 8126]
MAVWRFGAPRYSLLRRDALAADQSATDATASPPRSRFALADVWSSRRLRLWVPVLLTAMVLLVSGSRRFHTPSVRTWRPATDGTPADERRPEPPPVTSKPPPLPSPAPPSPSWPEGPALAGSVDWSRFAYTQYVTDLHYLCNSVMLFERLHHLGSRAGRVMMYPSHMFDPTAADGGTSVEARLLRKARDEYNVRLVPIQVQRRDGGDKTWAESYTKLLAFNQTQYDRVLSLDSDSVVLQHMDELFLLPPCPMAMPRAYWLYPEKKVLSSQVMLLQPSEAEFARVMDKINAAADDDYDMEIVNQLYGDSAMVLPHRPYDLLTGEFRHDPDEHAAYLGSEREKWDPVAAFNEAKFLHFSDWPLPKPWLVSEAQRLANQPKCHQRDGGVESCAEREIWNGIYADFAERRKRVCGTGPGRPWRQRRR